MRFKSLALIAFLALGAVSASPALSAGIDVFSPSKGTVYLPGVTPSPAGGSSSPIVASPLSVDTGTKAATATGSGATGTATLNKNAGTITTPSLTTAALATYTLTLTDSTIAVGDEVMASVGNGTNSAGTPDIASVTPGAGSVVIVVQNANSTTAFNGTLTIAFVRFKN